MVSKLGPEKMFHPAAYVTCILPPDTIAEAPGIALMGRPDTFTPLGIIMDNFVIAPSPLAISLYVKPVRSPLTAISGSIYAYAAGVEVNVGVAVCVTVPVTVCVTVSVTVCVTVSVTV